MARKWLKQEVQDGGAELLRKLEMQSPYLPPLAANGGGTGGPPSFLVTNT